MKELKSCPFCGGTNLFVGTIAECEMQDETHTDYKNNSKLYTVCCDYTKGGCGASNCAQEKVNGGNYGRFYR